MVACDDGVYIDTAVPMDQLQVWFNPHGYVVKSQVKNLSDLHANLIFNGTGLGSSPWNDDNTLISVPGHLSGAERSRAEKSTKHDLDRPQ